MDAIALGILGGCAAGACAVAAVRRFTTRPPDAQRLAAVRAAQRALLAELGATAAVQLQYCDTRLSGFERFRNSASCHCVSATLLAGAARPRIDAALRAAGLSPQRQPGGRHERWLGGAIGTVSVSEDSRPLATGPHAELLSAWRQLRTLHRGEILVEIQCGHEDRRFWQRSCPGYGGEIVFVGLVEL